MRLMAVIGLLIGLGGAAALAWNEFALARQLDALGQADAVLARAGPDDDTGIIYVVGQALPATEVRDPQFEISIEALRLDRSAETYQWLEHREGSGDNKNLRYEKIWSPMLIPSARFEQRAYHANPAQLQIESARAYPEGARLETWVLDRALIDVLPAIRELRPERAGRLQAAGLTFRRAGDWLYSGDPASPAIGDVRVRFAIAPAGLVSVVAAREGGRLVPVRSAAGGTVALAAYGDVAAEALLREAARANWSDAWALRGFGAMAILLGTLFAMPLLSRHYADRPAFRSPRHLGTMLMLAAGISATVCALGWAGARLLLQAARLVG